MALGWATGVDGNTYLLMGVPITLAFQWWIARRPLRALWVRDATRFQLDRRGFALAAAFAIVPADRLLVGLRTGIDPAIIGWLVCAIAGAFAAAYAFRHFRADTFRVLVRCMIMAGVIGAAVMVLAWLARGRPAPTVGAGVESLLMYLPVAFVFEEVFFRGALDTHVHQPGEARGRLTALFVSVLWALWHLPMTPQPAAALPGLLIVHVAIGVPLSLCWRQSGNLAVPAVSHAVIDAIRNALLR